MGLRAPHPFRMPGVLGLILVMFCATAMAGPSRGVAHGICTALRPLADGSKDAAPALQHCLDSASPGSTVQIPAGSYLLLSPIIVRRPLALTTAGLPSGAPACRRVDPRCATLLPTMSATASAQAPMPIDFQADNLAIDHIIFAGSRTRAPKLAATLCLSTTARGLAGGLRLNGQNVHVTRSVFRDFACYSAFEMGAGSGVITDNLFANNGTHNVNMMWSDGLTIHDGKHLRVSNNLFVDNTDVQLIFGGCTDCSVTGNRFRHSIGEAGGSFAELMIHAWPAGATSGRYDGTVVSNNDIDCGPRHRCGFGIMIGARPWYQAPTSGGTLTGNHVRNAMLGINVDGLSGPVQIGSNQVVSAPGSYRASCGAKSVTAGINLAPSSRGFVSNAQVAQSASAESYADCLLNYPSFSRTTATAAH